MREISQQVGIKMRIKGITLKGWRSFCNTKGILLSNLKHINLLIGPNNSGKSNLFKYFYYLRKLVQDTITERNKNQRIEEIYGIYNKIEKAFPEKDTWACNNYNISCEILLEEISCKWDKNEPTFHRTKPEICLTSLHNIAENRSILSVKYDDKNYLLYPGEDKPKLFNPDTKRYEEPVEGIGYPYDTYEYWTAFIKTLVFVDPIRHFDRQASSNKECDFDGSNIITDIIELRNKRDNEWYTYKSKMQEWLKVILAEPKLEIDPTGMNMRFYINRGGKTIPADLHQLGTGVAQIFMMLSFLFINRSSSLNVFIEEPECNLHPDAVVQLVRIIKENFPNHRFFISTHSTVLIDQLDSSWTINKVIRKGDNASIVQPCDSIVKKYELLDELGIRASQLLQSNYIIWVEGPSDRIYINKWIKDLSNGELIEGKHYSFLMYGGSNLASYSIINDERFINILSVGRNCAVVCDSDKNEEGDKLKERVTKIQNRIEELKEKESEYNEDDIENYIYLWITEGREVENYVPHNIFIEVLSSDMIKKHFLYKNKERKELVIYTDALDEKEFGKFDSFENFYSEMYKFIDGEELSKEQKASIAEHYTAKKVEIAKEVINKWRDEFYDNQFNLKDSVNELIKRIKKANGL